MRVLMYYSNSDVRLEEMPVPRIGTGEMLMKIMASGICGSDVMEWYRRDKVPLVLVLGSGISGLLHVGLARALGAGLVVAADTIPFRIKKAREMGAHLAARADEDLVERFREANHGRLADLVIICFEGFIPLATKCVERGGTILFFGGASEGAMLPATINELFWRTEITLTSTYAGSPADCVTALDLIKAGSIPVEKLVTHRLRMDEATGAFGTVCVPGDHECVKVIVEPQRSE